MKRAAYAVLAALVIVLPLAPTSAGENDPSRDHVVKKQKHFRTVVEELSKRDASHLTKAQQQRRKQALERLLAYADAGVFPVDVRFTGFGVPYLIDDRGTRCALAHLIDVSGHGEIVSRLAKSNNHDFVPELMHDAALRAWLVRNGFTVEEAAFIQLPPFTDDQDDVIDPPEPPDDPTPPPPSMPSTPQTAPPADVTGPSTEGGLRRGPRGARARAPTWQLWWSLNRHAFVDLRARYHDAAVVTGRAGEATPEGYRPRDAERNSLLAPTFWQLTKQGDDIGATALMALARMGRAQDADPITEQALAYVARDKNAHRGLMLLAVGLAGTETGTDALLAIAGDTPKGRLFMGTRRPLPEQHRAFAAVAAGLTGRPAAIAPLLALLDDDRAARADLKACCVTALGLLGKAASPMERARLRARLVDGARTRAWHDDVLAAVPAALLHMEDAGGLESLSGHLARFRKPQSLRQGLALAQGALDDTPSRQTVDMLLASARRDPDPLVRRYAIVSLGQRTPTTDDMSDDTAASRRVIARFFASALKGHHVGQADRPWVYLGAALHARQNSKQADAIRASLIDAAKDGADRSARAAAAIGLGLLKGTDARDALRELLRSTKDEELRPFVAEALGMLGDRASKLALMQMLRTEKSATVRYRAALGLGYLADRRLVAELVTELEQAKSVPVRTALTRVVGEIGDRSAIPLLISIANDADEDELTRMRAIAALGLIGEIQNPTWIESLKEGANRATATPTLKTVLSIF
ncbi:MAG: HEAT repeat domain-containing protein [Planctomycetota bacterium]|nr:HEAT repeat domain-containing protein [Planctomycetota bacterium]